MTEVRTTCPYCGVGCGVVVRRDDSGAVSVVGDRSHPANEGRLCSKGSALAQTLALDGRALHPQVDGVRTTWDHALDHVASQFARTIAEHCPESVAFYVSGQILTEDYYVANKLMKGFIGSANIDTNSRLCMASSVAGHRRAFGSDTVPGVYADIDEADLVVLVGSNLAWCHPVLHQRLLAARQKRGARIVVIDPRESASCADADLHLALAPGSDVALFNGLLTYLADVGCLDEDWVSRHTRHIDEALAAARSASFLDVGRITGLKPSYLQRFFEMFAAHERVVTVYSQGVNQSVAGVDKVNAIINCHLATGRIGRAGMGPFSVTGQPNAMGGREVGGLANMLACHMEIENAAHRALVQRFWQAPRIAQKPGLKAVDLFEAVHAGRIRALWVMGTNPVFSLPRGDRVAEALSRCPFVVVSETTAQTETAALAHVVLPSLAWGEKDGTVTNSERRISRQRAFLPAPGQARADWRQMADVARRMGFGAAFGWRSVDEVFAEYAALSALDNDGSRDFDIGACATMDAQSYAAMEPFQWPLPAGAPVSDRRFFADGGFFTPDGRARFVPVTWRAPASGVDRHHPLLLNTGRLRDQWHSMTRTGLSARLMSHAPEPFVEIHPDDAARQKLTHGALAEIASRHARVVMRVRVTDRQARGEIFAPIHWASRFASRARINALVDAHVDALSGQPESKITPVSATPFAAAWHGFAASIAPPAAGLGGASHTPDYWALAPTARGWRLECAGLQEFADWGAFARSLLVLDDDDDVLAYRDRRAGQARFAAFRAGRLVGVLFIARAPLEVARSWLCECLDAPIADGERLRVLAGRPGAEVADKGAVVCSCFDVGAEQIAAAVASGCASVEAIGAALRAGTNCGSCRSEIARLLGPARVASLA